MGRLPSFRGASVVCVSFCLFEFSPKKYGGRQHNGFSFANSGMMDVMRVVSGIAAVDVVS
jgi:hypothetical protein